MGPGLGDKWGAIPIRNEMERDERKWEKIFKFVDYGRPATQLEARKVSLGYAHYVTVVVVYALLLQSNFSIAS